MRYHTAINVNHILAMSVEEAGNLLSAPDDQGGVRTLSSAEVFTHAILLKCRGYEVVPVGCTHHNAKGYCLGHTDDARPAAAAPRRRRAKGDV